MHILSRVLQRCRRDGVMATVQHSGLRLLSSCDSFLQDRRRGVETALPDRLPAMRAIEPSNHFYRATAYRTFRQIMSHVRLRPGEDVFVDFGSGKGRVLLLAAEYPFRRVIGIEYSRELHQQAQANLAAARARLRCRDVECICADATEWSLPARANVLFFYNPFEGPVLAKVCENIRASLREHPRRLTLIYVRPDTFFEREIQWQSWLRRRVELPCVEGRVAIYETWTKETANEPDRAAQRSARQRN